MKSKTKVTLSHADIQRLVNRAYDSAPILTVQELADGYFNTAYHIKLGEDRGETVLELGPPAEADLLSYEHNVLRAEVDAMRRVATNPDIPVPRIFCEDFSRGCVPYEYYFMDFLEGRTWDKIRVAPSDEQNNSIERQLGEITAI